MHILNSKTTINFIFQPQNLIKPKTLANCVWYPCQTSRFISIDTKCDCNVSGVCVQRGRKGVGETDSTRGMPLLWRDGTSH